MLELKSFNVENGGCITSANVPLQNQGLTLIHGVNHDEGGSNGAGKSFLLELLAYTLTGKTGRGGVKNDLLNGKESKNFHTSLEFARDGNDYRVEHYRAHKEHGTCIKLFENGVNISPTTRLDDVQALALAKSGFKATEFFGQAYLCQSYTHALVNGTPAEKKKYLSMYFGLDPIDMAVSITKKRLNSIVIPNESELRDMVESAKSQLSTIPDHDTILEKKTLLTTKQESISSRLNELKFQVSQQKAAKEVSEYAATLELELAKLDIAFTIDALQAWCEKEKVSIADIRSKYKLAVERDMLREKLRKLGVDTSLSYTEVRQKIANVSGTAEIRRVELESLEARQKLTRRLAALTPVPESLKDLTLTLRQKTIESNQYQGNATTLKSELQKLAFQGTKCPTCFRDITVDEHKALIEKRKADLEIYTGVLSELRDDINDLQMSIQTKEETLLIEADLSEIPDGDYDQVRVDLESLVQQKAELQKLADDLVQVTSIQDRLKVIGDDGEQTHEVEAMLSYLDNLYTYVNQAREWLLQNGKVKFDPQILSLAENELIALERQYNEVTEGLIEQTRNLTTRQNLEKQLESVESILAKNKTEMNRRHVLEVMHLSINKITAAKLKEASDMLTSILPMYIQQLFPRGNVKIGTPEEEGEFDLYLDKGGQQIPLFMVSGGQGKRVALAIFFAFAKMGAKNCNVLMLDEPMRDLDPFGRGVAMEIIQDLNIPSVFVTSHDLDLMNSHLYNQVWTVEMRDDKSILVR